MITILLVDDDRLARNAFRRLLRAAGYAVAAFATAGEALDWMQHNRPALAVLDVELGGELDGVALASVFAAMALDEASREPIPIVFHTSLRAADVRCRCSDLRCTDRLVPFVWAHLPKPASEAWAVVVRDGAAGDLSGIRWNHEK